MEEIHDGFLKKYMKLKEELSRKEITRELEMILKCISSIDLVWDGKVHEKWEKIHILGTFRRLVAVHFELVPVHIVFWSSLANIYRYMLDMYRYNPVQVFLFRPVFVFWP